MIYPPNHKPARWAIDSGIVAHNCIKHGMPHPIIAMPMWEGAGNRARDYSGRGNHGSLTGHTKWINEGLYFDGDGDYVQTAVISDDMVATKGYTLTYRINTTDAGAAWAIRHLLVNDGADGFGTAPAVGGQVFVYTDGGNTLTAAAGGTAVNDGITHDVVACFDQVNNIVSVYIDGILDYQVSDYTDDSATTNAILYICTNQTHVQFCECDITAVNYYESILTPRQVMFLHDNPYFMYQVPSELYGYVVELTGTGLFDGRIRIKNTSTTLADGLIILKDKKIDLFDGNLSILDAVTNNADGKIQIQDDITTLLDGKVIVQDEATLIFDGLVKVKDTTTTLADGKVQIQNTATGQADGKISIKDIVTGIVDGKIDVTVPGSATDNADGKIQIKDVTTAQADGVIKIQDDVINLADGKVNISDVGINLVDGAIQIKDTDLSLFDGSVRIAGAVDTSTNLFNGILQIPARYRITPIK